MTKRNRFSMLQESAALLEETIEAIGSPPVAAQDVDWVQVLEFAADIVKNAADIGHEGKDAEHYLYEAVMQAVYGDGYWDWLRVVT